MPATRASSILLLCVGMTCMSSSFLFIRLSSMEAVPLAACRLVVSTLVTLPLFFRAFRRDRAVFRWADLQGCLGPGIALGLHLILWNIGCRMTTAANSTLIVNLSPIALPFALWFLAKEKVVRGELIATALAFSGLVVLATLDHHAGSNHLAGDMVCFASMLMLACYVAFSRKSAPAFREPWLFIVPVYGAAAVTCSIATLIGGRSPWPGSSRDWWCVMGMVLFPTILGHGLWLMALRQVRGQIAGIFGASQFIPASVLAWLALGEMPSAPLFQAAGLVLTGMIVALRAKSV